MDPSNSPPLSKLMAMLKKKTQIPRNDPGWWHETFLGPELPKKRKGNRRNATSVLLVASLDGCWEIQVMARASTTQIGVEMGAGK